MSRFRIPLVFFFSVLLGAFFLTPLNLFELFFLDARFVITSAFDGSGDTDDSIVVVLMDTASEEKLGVPVGSKWREFFPDFVDTVYGAGADVIAFDLEFLSEEEEFDGDFAASLESAGNVIAGEWDYGTTTGALEDAFAGIGSLRVEAVKGRPRRIRIDGENTRLPLSVIAAGLRNDRKFEDTIRERGGFWIYFDRTSESFPTYSFADIYSASEGRIADERRTPLSVFKDKIVLVGIDLPGSDRHAFPYTFGSKIPGVFGQAAAIETVLSGRFLRTLPWWANLCILAACIALYCPAIDISKTAVRRIITPLFPVFLFVLSVIIFAQARIWVGFAPLFVSSIATVLAHWTVNRGILRMGLRRAIGFDPELVERFRRQAKGGIVQENVTVLCADVRDYTAFVTSVGPDKVSLVMNEYLRAMEEIISAEGGYVNKYVGDEILAVFGFPLSFENSSLRAVRSAVAMLERVESLVAGWNERNIDGIRQIGIGIDYGTVTFAEMGGRSRKQFDIIGNAVNGASRLQSLTKEVKYHLAVPKEVYDRLLTEDENKSIVETFMPLGSFGIRGQGERLVYVCSKKK